MNQLQFETSPYLLQHQHNPVDWFAWKPAAFEKARLENKPILVSIGYSTCHWCHVMERESFEDEATARLMNDHFICIKVDREERPDVDQIYMEACQILTGSGGWPLNCFLTPDGKPFFAGTYWPPRPAFGRPAWSQVLMHINKAWSEKRAVAEEQAEQLLAAIRRNDGVFLKSEPIFFEKPSSPLGPSSFLETIFYQMRDSFDRLEGGFGSAPKFPSAMAIQFLFAFQAVSKNEEALSHAVFSLEKMVGGGIYDQLGGGFARYSTDREWLVPHFEKMLYDNALLLSALADAYKITRRPLFLETIEETVGYVLREMTSPEGGFYSAQDADSEGEEGKFFVWTMAEIAQILGEDEARLFCEFYGATEQGNFEEKNILWRPVSFEDFAKTHGLDLDFLKTTLAVSRQKLLAERSKRIRPSLDDKILLGWNGLMISALTRCFEATGHESYRAAARRGLDFLLKDFQIEGSDGFFHSWKNGRAQIEAFLEDWAFLLAAMLDVYEITFEIELLKRAEAMTDVVFKNFWDEATATFFFTASSSDLILRRRDLYDNATPSGNSTMAMNLQRLGIHVGREDFRETARRMLGSMRETVERYPLSFERWALAMLHETTGLKEIAVVGRGAMDMARQISRFFLPSRVLAASETGFEKLPLFEGKTGGGAAQIFVCENYACRAPLGSVDAFLKNIDF